MSEGFKALLFDDDAREGLRRGVESLAQVVRVTMGPSGQNVIIEVPGAPPIVTKDGVTVARSIDFRDRNMNLGAQIIKEAASRTCDAAGDGTTTATVLTHAIFTGGLRVLSGDHSGPEVKAGMSWAVASVIEELREIGELLAQAMRAVGRDGTITVEEAKGFATSLHVVDGAELDRGYLSPYFVTDSEKMISSLENPYVLLTNNRITALKEILPLLEKIHTAQKPILIVADDIEGEAMQGLVVNRTKGILQVSAIKGPEFGENRFHALQDLAVLLGTRVITGESELATVRLEELGRCKRAIIGRYKSVIIDAAGKKDELDARAQEIRNQIEDPTIDQQDRETLRRRLSRLAGGVAILRVGGATEPELKERCDRVDDALHATKAAVDEGILPGGGTALVRAAARARKRIQRSRSDSFKQGVDVVLQACCAPLRQISINAGSNPELVLSKVERLRDNMGYDAASERYVDTLEAGIVDPLKVVRSALENAHSAASMLLSVGCTVVDDSLAE